MIPLTLSIEENTIRRAKTYAEKTGRSLTELMTKYLESLALENEEQTQISPKLKRIVGSVQLPENFNEEKELRDYLEHKYL